MPFLVNLSRVCVPVVAVALLIAEPGGLSTRLTAVTSPAQTPPAPAPELEPDPSVDIELEPPDGQWLRDEQGNRYFIESVPKKHAVRIGERSIRTIWGVAVDVEREDADNYYFRVYRDMEEADSPEGPSPEALAAISATYRVESRESHRFITVPFGTGLPTSGQWRDGFAVGDMNRDGHVDIVHGPARRSLRGPVIFLGDGKGGFQQWKEARFPRLAYDYGDAAVADFNGDGVPDLALGVHFRGLLVLLGDAKGAFRSAGDGLGFDSRGQSAFSSRAIDVADWDGDGRVDLIAVGEGPRLRIAPGAPATAASVGVAVFRNTAEGAWQRLARTGGSLASGSLAIGDVNGDKRLDAITGSTVLGRRDLLQLATAGNGWEPVELSGVRPRAYVRAVAARDLDRDGRADLVVAYQSFESDIWRTGIDVLYSRVSGWTRAVAAASETQVGIPALALGNVDGDGRPDLVAGSANGDLLLFPGDENAFFTREPAPAATFAGLCRATHLELVDIDRDGRDEVIAAFGEEAGAAAQTRGEARRCPSEGGIAIWKVEPRR